MYNLGTVHLRAGDLATAEVWFREALRLDPGFAEANQNLAALLQDDGRATEAQRYRDRAFRHTPLRVEHAPQPELRVLVLCGAGYGNVPIETLLPRQTTTRLKFFVEYASAADWAALPPFDVVFNAIGDADFLPPGAWQDHLSRLGTNVLNLPAHVARTRRDLLPTLLAGLPDVVVPRVVRQSECSHASDLIYPVLFRPIGAHGGDGVTLLPSVDSVPPGEAYLTEYHEYRSADGYFRKYRVIYIAGVPFAYHLAISPHWLVHYFSADMQEAAWKRAEE
jgi:tetratricopeptide (TPR) repeat protein